MPFKEFCETRAFLQAEEGRRDEISTIIFDNREAVTQTRCKAEFQIKDTPSEAISIEVNKPVDEYLVKLAARVRAEKFNLQYTGGTIVVPVSGRNTGNRRCGRRNARCERTALLIECTVKGVPGEL